MSDVLVIGGGLVGAMVTWRLAQAGQKVALVERKALGAGASSAAAGILGAQVEARPDGPVARLGLASRALFAPLAEELRERTGVSIGLEWPGTTRIVEGDDELALARARAMAAELAWMREAGCAVEVLDADALRRAEPAVNTRHRAAIHFPGDGLVDPVALLGGVERALVGAGATLHLGRDVTRVTHERGRTTGVLLEDGTELVAETVVVCAGAWSSLLEGLPEGLRKVRPVRGQMAEVQLGSPALRSIVFSGHGYVVPRKDGRAVLGSTMEEAGFAAHPTPDGLGGVLARSVALVPGLAHAPLLRTWAGLRPAPEGDAPLIGATGITGLLVASGHFRAGILLAPVTAELVRAVVLGTAAPLDLAPFDPRSPAVC